MPDAGRSTGAADPYFLVLGAAIAQNTLIQLPNGKAGISMSSGEIGDTVGFRTTGKWPLTKTASIVMLAGGRAYWDHSANAVHFKTVNDRDFFIGCFDDDAAAADETVIVRLNEMPVYEIDLLGGPHLSQTEWTTEATNGLGTTLLPGGGVQLAFHAVTQAAQAAIYPTRTFNKNANGILEMKVAVFDKGDNAALDWNFGVANGSHGTDFESVTEFVGFHLDGNSLVINSQSRDGTTTVAVATTTISFTDGVYKEFWIDYRDLTSVKLHIDGVRVNSGSTFRLDNATGPLFPILHLKKTSDDTLADVRMAFCRKRTGEQ